MLTKDELPDCPVATTLRLIGNKWKILIIQRLIDRPYRFNELCRSIDGLSEKVLTDNLKALERDGIITRTVYPLAFLDERKNRNVERTGSTDSNSFLLVIPGESVSISVGDKVLQAVVDCAYQNSRVSDKIIRWGGDEFIGIFDGMKLDYCHSFAKKMLEAVRNIEIVTETSKVHVTVSIGFSYFKNADLSYKEVIDRADLALYDSKHKGKNAMSIHM